MKQYRYIHEAGKMPTCLANIPFIQSIPERHLRHVLATGTVRDYAPGEVIIHEQTRDSWVFITLVGRTGVSRNGRQIAELGEAGTIFGEQAAIDDVPRAATVTAMTRTICLAIDWSAVRMLEQRGQNACCLALYRLFVNILSERLRYTTGELARLKQAARVQADRVEAEGAK